MENTGQAQLSSVLQYLNNSGFYRLITWLLIDCIESTDYKHETEVVHSALYLLVDKNLYCKKNITVQ